MRPATAALHGLERVQGVAPLAPLLVGPDEVGIGHSIGRAVMLRHALEHEAGLVELAAVGTGCNHAVEDAHVWLAALQCQALLSRIGRKEGHQHEAGLV